jgi:hypothetical protein
MLLFSTTSKTDLNQGFMLLGNRLELSALANFLVVMTLGAMVILSLPNLEILSDLAQYANLHLILESISLGTYMVLIVLCFSFTSKGKNSHTIALGAGFACVALLDLAHALSYAGMPDLVTPSSPEKAINFWLAARFVGAITLLCVAFCPPARLSIVRGALIYLGSLVLASVVIWIGLYHPTIVPRTFIEGEGLTLFKIGAELVITALYFLACLRFFFHARTPGLGSPLDQRLLFAATWLLVLTEIFFCLYTSVTDVLNMAGHLYKIAGVMVLALAARPILIRRKAAP